MKSLIIISIFCIPALLFGGELKIAENGTACAGILIPEKARPVVKFAAAELADYLKKITGAEFMIGTSSKYKTNFKLGFGDPTGLDAEEFIIRTRENDIEIFGHDSNGQFYTTVFFHYNRNKGTLQGVYYFLELLGVRWPAPGMDHVPEQRTLILKPLDIRFKPYFRDRQIGSTAPTFVTRHPDGREYCRNNEEAMRWYIRIGESPRHFGCHSERVLGLYKDPEWKSDITRLQLTKNGKRDPHFSCWTHPDVKRIWMKAADAYFSGKTSREAGFIYASQIRRWSFPFLNEDEFMIDPMDNSVANDGRCCCERCQQFRKEHPCPDDTELIWNVIIDVAAFIEKKHPGKYIVTLVYPPKRQIPNRKLPSNIKVRICLGGPKQCLSAKSFNAEIDTIKNWRRITGRKVPLWTYHCVGFGNSMPHIVETYPHLITKYVQTMKDNCEGMFMETHSQTFTRKLPDTYIFHRLMRNPDLDVDRELDEYFRILYGPAHAEARTFWNAMENAFISFWKHTVPQNAKPGLVTPWGYHTQKVRQKLWKLVYTEEFLDDMGKLVAAMEKKTAGTRYAKPVALLKKYIYDDLVRECNMALNREKIRKNIVADAVRLERAPRSADWENASEYTLVPAKKFAARLAAPASFKFIADKEKLYFRAVMSEPAIKNAVEENPASAIWNDNCAELFFYSDTAKIKHQIVIGSSGIWNCCRRSNGKSIWKLMPGAEIKVKKNSGSWVIEAAFPLAELAPEGGNIRFNITRNRRVLKRAMEVSTWSYLAGTLGRHEIENYGNIRFK